MNVLIACEESQRVCCAFRSMGHNAFSCDIKPPSGGFPEFHIMGDVLQILNGGCFVTMDEKPHNIEKWDLIISHPPCTYLTNTGNKYFNVNVYGEKAIERKKQREQAINFFMEFVNADCEKIAIENPVGCMSTIFRKPTQIIQPYQFGNPAKKRTCLWLKNLPPLQPTLIVEPNIIEYRCKNGRIAKFSMDYNRTTGDKSTARSKTYWGIAYAMSTQWGGQP